MTVVIDHDSGRLVWAAPGHDKATLQSFFDLLGPQRCTEITHVSADGADFISTVVAKNCPHAVRCADPFHVVRWATEALDLVRRQAWNEARKLAQAIRQSRNGGIEALGGPSYVAFPELTPGGEWVRSSRAGDSAGRSR